MLCFIVSYLGLIIEYPSILLLRLCFKIKQFVLGALSMNVLSSKFGDLVKSIQPRNIVSIKQMISFRTSMKIVY